MFSFGPFEDCVCDFFDTYRRDSMALKQELLKWNKLRGLLKTLILWTQYTDILDGYEYIV